MSGRGAAIPSLTLCAAVYALFRLQPGRAVSPDSATDGAVDAPVECVEVPTAFHDDMIECLLLVPDLDIYITGR